MLVTNSRLSVGTLEASTSSIIDTVEGSVGVGLESHEHVRLETLLDSFGFLYDLSTIKWLNGHFLVILLSIYYILRLVKVGF